MDQESNPDPTSMSGHISRDVNGNHCNMDFEPSTSYAHGLRSGSEHRDECFAHAALMRSPFSLHIADGSSDRPMQRYLQEPLDPFMRAEQEPLVAPFATVPFAPLPYACSDASLVATHRRYPSSSRSGFSPGRSDNVCDDTTSWSSPSVSVAASPPEAQSGSCHYGVPHDIQHHADAQHEDATCVEAATMPTCFVHEGYHPMQQHEGYFEDYTSVTASQPNNSRPMDVNLPDADAGPASRRRRPRAARAVTSPQFTARVTRRPAAKRRSTSFQGICNDADSVARRAFRCPFAIYGCDSAFASKNEWKRHVATQHMRFGFWRCDQCPEINRRPHDFNRKDLFVQHVRRMHSVTIVPSAPSKPRKKSSISKVSKDNVEEPAMAEMASRCYRPLRAAPERSGCLFCNQTFTGKHSWGDRMEHIGRHMDSMKKAGLAPARPDDWNEDTEMERYLVAEGIVVWNGARLVLALEEATL